MIVGESTDNELTPRTWGGFWDIFGVFLVDKLHIKDGDYVLDFGTGAGSVLYPAAKRVAPRGHIVGIEKSEYWVKRTSAEIKRCAIKNAEIRFMDGRKMDFDDEVFDCAVAGFIGWDNYFDFTKLKYRSQDDPMVREIKRVLKSGGKFGLSTWLVQKDLDWMYEFLSSNNIPCRTCYSAENEEGWEIIMKLGGFHDVQFFKKSVSLTYDSKEHWWKEMRDYNWTIDGNDEEIISEAIRKKAYVDINNHLTEDGGVEFSRDALIVIGIK